MCIMDRFVYECDKDNDVCHQIATNCTDPVDNFQCSFAKSMYSNCIEGGQNTPNPIATKLASAAMQIHEQQGSSGHTMMVAGISAGVTFLCAGAALYAFKRKRDVEDDSFDRV